MRLMVVAVVVWASLCQAAVCGHRTQQCKTVACCEGENLACVTGVCRAASPGTTTTTSTTATPTTTRPGNTTTTLETFLPPSVLPTAQDITIRLPRSQRCKWVAGRTAMQPERAAMYLLGVAKLMPEGLLYAKYTKPCVAVSTGKSASDMETEDLRLRSYYVDKKRNPVWGVFGDNGCPDYEHVQNEGERLQACSTKDDAAKRACAASPYMTGDLLAWTDMRIENARCEKGARFIVSLPTQENPTLVNAGILDYRVPLVLSPAYHAGVDALVAVHHQADDAYCDGTPGPPPGSVQAAATALFLAPGLSPRERQAALVIFTPTRDEGSSGWTKQQSCDWKRLEGVAMHLWGERCEQVGTPLVPSPLDVWPCITRGRIIHETLHRCAAFKNGKLVRLNDLGTVQLTSQPSRTCAEWLQCQTGERLKCRLPWVPENWRTLIAPPAVL